MTREEFFEWLESLGASHSTSYSSTHKCPTHKWEITHEEYGHVVVSYPTDAEPDND